MSSTSPIASTSTTTTASPDECVVLPTSTPSELASSLSTASDLLHQNLPVAFPTETVYGLGASALSTEAVSRVFKAKGRPSDNPLIVHISNLEMLYKLLPSKKIIDTEDGTIKKQVVGMNKLYEKLIESFWPGPLSLIFKNLSSSSTVKEEEKGVEVGVEEWLEPEWKVSELVTCGLDSLCIRMPRNDLALKLIETSDLPLAAPSANLSSRPSPTRYKHVLDDLGKGRGLGAVLKGDDECCQVGVESTVVDFQDGKLRILRAGGISVEQIENCLQELGKGVVQVYSRDFKSKNLESNPTTPGMKYKHYSPGNSKVILVKPNFNLKENRFLPSLQELIQLSCLTQKKDDEIFKVGLMLTDSTLSKLTPEGTLEGEEEEGKPIKLRLNEDKNQESLFATLSQGEESNLPELSTIDIYSLPLSTSSSSSSISKDDVGEEAGRRLFNGLRLFDSFGKDEKGVDLILVECVEEKGVGFAVMERARKAAGGIEKGNEMEFAL